MGPGEDGEKIRQTTGGQAVTGPAGAAEEEKRAGQIWDAGQIGQVKENAPSVPPFRPPRSSFQDGS